MRNILVLVMCPGLYQATHDSEEAPAWGGAEGKPSFGVTMTGSESVQRRCMDGYVVATGSSNRDLRSPAASV